MIFVTVGTWHLGFDRLVAAVHELVATGVVTEEIVAQVGHGSFQSPLMKSTPFLNTQDFTEHMQCARVVISHAGVGSIAAALDLGTPTVVVPRKAALSEADNDHQFTTAKRLESERKVLVAYETDQLPSKLREAERFVPERAEPSPLIMQEVLQFLESVDKRRRRWRKKGK